ncbi:hypothetical protein B4589_009875 [Halolamina sp. CBA1230]|uniref:hypothetical protein n=1 Tax=Halolamina sp. CBA1230 TaxID=1853690 RepID=UPI00117AC9A9|nr:hypothetical protein [Halolamina sp. CBA1230]QKY20672.1 hypothetical protein B4589_009875 [Halolamina sp. CBA1230]
MATISSDRIEDTSKKVRIAAAWLLDSDFHRKRAAEVLSVSGEYIRQVVRDMERDERELVADHELEAAQDKMLQAEIAQRLRDADAISTDTDPATIEIHIDDLNREIRRLRTLEESARRGDEEREWVAASARAFLENLVEDST